MKNQNLNFYTKLNRYEANNSFCLNNTIYQCFLSSKHFKNIYTSKIHKYLQCPLISKLRYKYYVHISHNAFPKVTDI